MSKLSKRQMKSDAVDARIIKEDTIDSALVQDYSIQNIDIAEDAAIELSKLDVAGATANDFIGLQDGKWVPMPSLAEKGDTGDTGPKGDTGDPGTTNHALLDGLTGDNAHPASSITNTPAGNIVATDVQAAINELDTEKAPVDSPSFTGTAKFSYATVSAGEVIVIPNNYQFITILDDTVTAANAITMPTGVNGQILIVYNADADSTSGIEIPSGSAMVFAYTNSAWEPIETINAANAHALDGKAASYFEPANLNIQQHISSDANPHSVTAAQAGAIATTHPANSISGFGTSDPGMDGIASSGEATTISRSDHIHPTDTSRAAANHDHDLDYAPIANGVTNGDLHDHSGGDGAQINHAALSNIGTNSHGAIDSHIAATNNPHEVTKTQVGLSDVTNDAQVPLAQKGAVSGVCPLNESTKIDTSYLPESILGKVEYMGTWSASTNTPAIPTAATENKGWYYIAIDSGSLFSYDFNTGDWIISDGTKWDKVDNTNQVSSVFGRIGDIVAANGDYTASQVTNVPSGNIVATTVQGAINELDVEKADIDHGHTGVYEPVIETLPVSKGGTGITSYTTGSFISAQSSTVLQQRTPAQVLSDIGAAPTAHTHTQAQSHNSADTDTATTALHHTLGTGANQAAAGNHLHAGVYEPADSDLQTHLGLTNNPHSVTKTQVGLGNVTNDEQIPLTQKGAANGVCPLGSDSKINSIYLPAAASGQLTFKGTWAASTNTPTLPTADSGNNGWYYICSDSGTQFSISFSTGDWVLSDGTAWTKVPSANAISSVFGRTGTIVATSGDYTANQITNVASGNISATNIQAAINELDSEKQPLDATLTALANLSVAANKLILGTGTDAFTVGELTNAYISATAAIDVSKLGQSSASTSNVLSWSGSTWVPLFVADANISSSAAINVSKLGASSASASDALVYNGSAWAPAKLSDSNIATDAGIVISKLGASSALTNDSLVFNGTSWAPVKIANANIATDAAISVSKLGQSAATTNQVLNWSGAAWAPTLIADANISATAAIGVSKLGASSAATDDVLAYSGSVWAPIKITASHVATAYKDGTAGTPSLRTLGTSATQAAAGNHNHAGTYEPVFSILSVSKGGTGVNTLTGLAKGNGTSAFTAAIAGTDYISPTGTETISNKTLTSPKILNTDYIADDNGNEQIQFSTTTDAINHVQVKNAAIGTAPSIIAIGDDTNIDLSLAGKGTGVVVSATAAADTNTTQLATTAFVVGQAGAADPTMNGTTAVGTSLRYSRQDHVHPTDTSRQPLDGTLTALAGLTTSADNLILATGADTFSVGQLTNAYVAAAAAIDITKLGMTGATTEDVIYYNGTTLVYGKVPIVPLEYYDTYTTTASTISATYISYRSMATTTLRAKTYKITWNFLYDYTAVNTNAYARIYLDGTTVLWEAAMLVTRSTGATRAPASGTAFITFGTAATHTIDLQYRSGGGTMYMYGSTISITEVRTS